MQTLSYWQRMPTRTSVAVVGGGVAGCSLAYWLADKGVDCVLLERDFLGAGASGKNDGQVMLECSEYYNRFITSMGRDRARTIFDFRRQCIQGLRQFITEHRVTCSLKPGCITLAGTPAEHEELDRELAALRADDFNALRMDADECERRGKTGGFLSGIYFPDDFCVNAFQLTQAIGGEARARGARVIEGARVFTIGDEELSFAYRGGSFALHFDMIVFATNAYTADLMPAWSRQLWPIRGQMLMTDVIAPDFDIPHGCQTHFGYDYWKCEGGRIMIGGHRYLDEMTEQTDEEGLNAKIQDGLLRFVREKYGASIQIGHQWSGLMCYSQDGLPLAGALPGHGNRYIIAGCTGYGLSYFFRAAQAIAAIIHGSADRHTQDQLTLFNPRRFR